MSRSSTSTPLPPNAAPSSSRRNLPHNTFPSAVPREPPRSSHRRSRSTASLQSDSSQSSLLQPPSHSHSQLASLYHYHLALAIQNQSQNGILPFTPFTVTSPTNVTPGYASQEIREAQHHLGQPPAYDTISPPSSPPNHHTAFDNELLRTPRPTHPQFRPPSAPPFTIPLSPNGNSRHRESDDDEGLTFSTSQSRVRRRTSARTPNRSRRSSPQPNRVGSGEPKGDSHLRPPRGLCPLRKFIPALLTLFRLFSIVPAAVGIVVLLARSWRPNTVANPACLRMDYSVAILWAILTAHQCYAFTTGLFRRWRTYYPLLPTLVRLLALQAICWQATRLTLSILGHDKRPVVCWAVVGSTTCFSRAIQIWATSNLPGRRVIKPKDSQNHQRSGSAGNGGGGAEVDADAEIPREPWMHGVLGTRGVGKRYWDWNEIGRKCAGPPACVYFVMAWVGMLRREMNGC